MTIVKLPNSKSFETPAGRVTITSVDTEGSPERCVKGHIRRKDNPSLTDELEYDLSGVVQAGRADLNVDREDGEAAAMMGWFRERRRLS